MARGDPVALRAALGAPGVRPGARVKKRELEGDSDYDDDSTVRSVGDASQQSIQSMQSGGSLSTTTTGGRSRRRKQPPPKPALGSCTCPSDSIKYLLIT